ncbi:MAG: hypothetical protein ABIK28_23135, partial [Planctomycetota bacterium]
GSPAFMGFLNTMDINGQSKAQLNTYGALDANLVGLKLYFAYTCNNPFNFVSNPMYVELVD